MHMTLALFDAPVPARWALESLAEAGVRPSDVAVVPGVPGTTSVQTTGTGGDDVLSLPTTERDLQRVLRSWGVPEADVGTCAEGVRRGAILVAVRVPTLSVGIVRSLLDGCGAVDLATHRERWDVDPGLRYGWATVGEPNVAWLPPRPAEDAGPPGP
jgi:hypothetical protein